MAIGEWVWGHDTGTTEDFVGNGHLSLHLSAFFIIAIRPLY